MFDLAFQVVFTLLRDLVCPFSSVEYGATLGSLMIMYVRDYNSTTMGVIFDSFDVSVTWPATHHYIIRSSWIILEAGLRFLLSSGVVE